MKQKILFLVVTAVVSCTSVSAQTYTETFSSNSLEWTECGYKNDRGNAIIDKGVLTINSLQNVEYDLKNKSYSIEKTTFESHCYAPIDVTKSFSIISDVTVKHKDEIGIVFNFRDFGNYYAFAMTDDYVKFLRYENGVCVGSITQGIRWKKKLKQSQTWELRSNGSVLEFIVNDEPIMKIRYMPLSYNGFGYYTVGKCSLIVDQVVFKQGH